MKYVEILEDIDYNWSIKEKARYIYQNICKVSSYDERFAYGKNQKLLYTIYNREIDIEQDEDTRLICRTACKAYYQLLDRVRIRSEIIYKKSNIERPIDIEDAALIFWDENGDKYYTNIAGDIENCRYGLKTDFFGIAKNTYKEAQDVKRISEEELKQIDIKIGYIKSDYNNVVFQLLAEEVKNTNNFKKFLKTQGVNIDRLSRDEILQNKLYYLNKLIKFRDRTAGADEQKKFYQKLFCSAAIDKFESKRFNTYEYVKENGEEIEVLSVIELNLSKVVVYYMYSEEEQTYLQLSFEEVIEKTKGYRERKGKKLVVQQEWDKEDEKEIYH